MRPILVVDVCGQAECRHIAEWRMFWPGSNPSNLCAEHKPMAEAVAEACGFSLVVEPLYPLSRAPAPAARRPRARRARADRPR